MKTVAITAGFTGYPDGKKRHFAEGEETDLADGYADLITQKGLARELPAKLDAQPTPAAAVPAETKGSK